MLDLNAMFGEFLSKAVADAVAVHTAELKDRIQDLERDVAMVSARAEDTQSTVDDLANKISEVDVKVAEDRMERMIEDGVEEFMRGFDFADAFTRTEESRFVSLVTESDEFEEAVRDAIVSKLQA